MRWFLPLLFVACSPKITTVSGGGGVGDPCTVDSQCLEGGTCAHDGTCQVTGELGTTHAGDECSDSVECAYGLVCGASNTCVEPGTPGTGEDGSACDGDEDCLAGHYCDGGVCEDVGVPFWEGGECPPEDVDNEYFYVLFDAPDLPATGTLDFYALPFPNDLRLTVDGHPDLSGHPDPGEIAPAVGAILSAYEALDKFPVNPTVTFRFSRKQEISSIRALTDDATVFFASLDPDADDYGLRSSLRYTTGTSRGKYVCQDWLSVTTYGGEPLLPDHTYAVWVTKGIRDTNGVGLTRDDGFKVMMQADRPGDLSLATAWDRYAPLRDFVDAGMVDGDEIAGAAVFTTGDPAATTRTWRSAGEDAAVVVSAARCGEGGACDLGCAGDGTYAELSLSFSLPDYRGADGAVAVDGSGRPQVQAARAVCGTLVVPPGEAPASGWPLVLSLPDLDARADAPITRGSAAAYAAAGVATLALDNPWQGAAIAFLDPADPVGWHGDWLQAVADPHAVIAWAGRGGLAAEDSPDGAGVPFDPDALWIEGHGLGGSVAVPVLAWSTTLRGGVLGNPWGDLRSWMVSATTPLDVKHALQVALGDSATRVSHPLVSLLGGVFDDVEPVDTAFSVVRDPVTEAKHLLVVEGVADTVVDPGNVEAVLRAGWVPVAGAVLSDYGQSSSGYPVFENISTEDGRRTAACVQVDADHDALAERAAQAAAFVASGTSGSPTISEP